MQTNEPAILRKEGWEKVTGVTQYVDDLDFPNMLHGATIRSSVARGRIKDIRFGAGIPWDEFVIVTAKDVPGKNHVALILYDQILLAADEVNHPEEAVLLIAHADKYLVEKARRSIEIVFEEKPGLFTIADSVDKKRIIWGDDNVFKSFHIEKGDIETAFKEADFIVEGEYFTGAQEQLYIEPNGVIATYDAEKGLTIWGSLQCPYYVHKAMKPIFNIEDDAKVRVIQTETGGGFGGKEEYPSMIAGHAALLAYKSGKPVKLIYDRAEDMVATTKRHPSRTRHRTAVKKDGRITGMDIDFVLDGGAYATLSAVVLSRGTLHATGPYEVDNIRLRSSAVATNTPPHGAFRGFGAPQSVFAVERHIEKIAQTIGMDSLELRRKNFLPTGGTTATGQVKKDTVEMKHLLERALELSDFHRKKERFTKENPHSTIKKGIGVATFFHGAGFTGSGERDMKSVAAVEFANGKVRALAASTEIGQGTKTIFSKIVMETLGLRYEDVEVAQPDTASVPNSGPTVASRTVMVVGKLIESASLELRLKLFNAGMLKENHSREDFLKACEEYVKKVGPLKAFSQFQQPPDVIWDQEAYKGDAYATYAWAAYVAEVSVDTVTYETKVDDFVALQEIGRVVHPLLAEGQIEGGVVQAIGYALYEKVIWKEGRMINNRMTNYIIPTAADLPTIRVFFEEHPSPHGPRGAKGIGELPMDGTAPAIINAINDALATNLNHIPVLPEDLHAALKGKKRD